MMYRIQQFAFENQHCLYVYVHHQYILHINCQRGVLVAFHRSFAHGMITWICKPNYGTPLDAPPDDMWLFNMFKHVRCKPHVWIPHIS